MRPSQPSWQLAAALTAAGAVALVVKGTVRAMTGADPSLVPWFGLGTTLGLFVAALAVRREVDSRAAAVAAAIAALGATGSVVAVAYLLAGTIPETADAPTLVGVSYGLLTAGGFLALLVLGSVVLRRRLLRGAWRWVPLAVAVAQFPIFSAAEVIGETVGRPTLADGLGLALTGGAWLGLAYALTRRTAQT